MVDSQPFTSLRTVKRLAIGVAMLEILETAMILAYIGISRSTGDNDVCSEEDYHHLSEKCLRNEWDVRSKYAWLDFVFSMSGGLSSLLLIPVILALVQLYQRRAKSYSVMLGLFITGAAIQAYEFLVRAGRHTTANYIYDNFHLIQGENIEPLRALEVSYIMLAGEKTWLFAVDQLLLAFGIASVSYLTYNYGQLPRWHAHLGVGACILGIIAFFLELARFGGFRLLGVITGIVIGVFGFVVFPLWLLTLGCTLGRNTRQFGEEPLGTRSGHGADEENQWAIDGAAHTDGIELTPAVETDDKVGA